MAIKVERSRGNVFADLGFPAEEAAKFSVDMLVKLLGKAGVEVCLTVKTRAA